MIVDLLFQNLVDLHGVDADALTDELSGPVRTPDYPGKGNAREVLGSLPAGFPRFRGNARDDRLIIERMRFPGDVVYTGTATSATLSIARPPQLPLSLVVGLSGRPLTDLVEGDGFDERMTILSARTGLRRENSREIETLELALDMPTTLLRGNGSPVAAPSAPRPVDMLSPRLSRYDDDLAHDVIASIQPLDPRRWQDVLAWRGALIGLRVEERRGIPHLVLRFPYDRRLARTVGTGGFGAWYDRDTWSWCMSAHDFDADAMMEALAVHDPVFILDQEQAVFGRPR